MTKPLVTKIVIHPKLHETQWHAHHEYQLFLLKSGLISFQFKNQRMILPAGQAGWIPPEIMHKAKMIGHVSAVFLYLDANLNNTLPQDVFAFTPTTLMQEIIARFAKHSQRKSWLKSDNNLMQVLLDEIDTTKISPLSLPMPKDKKIAFVAKKFISNPAMNESIQYWAKEAHMSKRSFTRHFRSETGMSFAKWCQQARVMLSLEYLSQKKQISWVSLTLGYNSVSAFIKVFKQWLGKTPTQYLNNGAKA